MTNPIPFSISEFCINNDAVPQEIANKILRFHIAPILGIRKKINNPIWPSDNSGWRPESYEIKRGRSGKSQHCFLDKGAVDWTCNENDLPELLELLKNESPYLRVCYYPNNGFIHCDYKEISQYRRYYECASLTSSWEFKHNL